MGKTISRTGTEGILAVFTLKNNLKVKSGNGTELNPYELITE